MLRENLKNNQLSGIYDAIQYIDTFFDKDIEIMLTDREKVLYYKGSKEIDFKIKKGDPIGEFVRDAMNKGL
ncbi:hypothetical protein [Clostridium saccharobutylicum]|uniref:hypothetical protein n=1 Tax=Clostridium saccharobutylicum TaxID=169679 RepID=UPI0007DE7EA4|nr:putative sensory transducer protein YfmS [Clostridium saccharobutylicum DSM 13864]